MQYLDNLLTNYNNLHVYSQSYVNQNDDEEIEYEIAFFIRNEIEQNTPSFSQKLVKLISLFKHKKMFQFFFNF